MTWTIQSCSTADGPSIAANNIPSFFPLPMWRLQWPTHITPAFLISQLILRQPHRLLRERDTLRHQKALDPVTGHLVGYARWRLPPSRTLTPEGEPEWKEAQIPEVSEERMRELEKMAREVWWEPRTDVDVLDEGNDEARGRVCAGREVLELEFLAVHPENQGRGIGTALVESGLREAERMGLPVVVVCWKEAMGMYRKLGFVEVERVERDDRPFGGTGEYTWYFMVWDKTSEIGDGKKQE